MAQPEQYAEFIDGPVGPLRFNEASLQDELLPRWGSMIEVDINSLPQNYSAEEMMLEMRRHGRLAMFSSTKGVHVKSVEPIVLNPFA